MRKTLFLKELFLMGFIMLFNSIWVWGQIVTFEFPATNSLLVTSKHAQLTVSDFDLSAGTITTNVVTGDYFPNEPYIEESTGWTASNQTDAKYYYFTITANSGYKFSITNISLNAYATLAGPEKYGIAINSDNIYSVDAPSTSLLSINQSISNQTNLSSATVKIQGWLDGSRSSSGSGSFRLDDLIISGSVTALETPFITVSSSSLNTFTYIQGNGPSASQSFLLEGSNLTNDITVTPPTNYEISTDNISFQSSAFTIGQSGGSVSQTIYTRLKAGLLQGDYNAEDISLSSSGAANKTVSCSGSVLSTSNIIINEVDADTDGTDVMEFIELFDGGSGNTSLDGLILVTYNGSDDLSDKAYDLDGYSTDANGYFVIGQTIVNNVDYIVSSSFIQNGPDAIALYNGNTADFPEGTTLTINNLIDAFVYDTDDADDEGLLTLLIAGQPQINEAGNGNSERHSNQRIPNGSGGARNTSTYGQYFPTPGAENDTWITNWTGALGTDWATSGNWSNGIPSENHDIKVPTGLSNYPIISSSTAANCYNLTLEGTATLTIVSDASNSGSLIFGGTYSGSSTAVIYQRYMSGTDWHMMGSPFTEQTINNAFLTANSIDGMKDYNENADDWNTDFTSSDPNTAFSLGKGYAVKRSSSAVVNLTGTLNNSTVNTTLTRDNFGWNLLSNPFSSAINATMSAHATNNLITANTDALDPSYAALYIWDQASTSYKIINNAGDGSLVQNYLQVGQGFFVKSKSGGGIFTMPPAMQNHQTSILFKSKEETDWASITLNAETSHSQAKTQILYGDAMHNGLDLSYDAGLLNSNPHFSLYSRLVEDNGIDFGLQCLPQDFEDLVIPIGLDAKAGDMIRFNATTSNIPEAFAVVLEDKTENVFTNLSNEGQEYVIQLQEDSEGIGRFYVRTSYKSTLAINNLAKPNTFFVFSRAKDNQLIIKGNASKTTGAKIYSITGKLLTAITLKQASENLIPFNEESGIYILQISNEEGTQTQKFAWIK